MTNLPAECRHRVAKNYHTQANTAYLVYLHTFWLQVNRLALTKLRGRISAQTWRGMTLQRSRSWTSSGTIFSESGHAHSNSLKFFRKNVQKRVGLRSYDRSSWRGHWVRSARKEALYDKSAGRVPASSCQNLSHSSFRQIQPILYICTIFWLQVSQVKRFKLRDRISARTWAICPNFRVRTRSFGFFEILSIQYFWKQNCSINFQSFYSLFPRLYVCFGQIGSYKNWAGLRQYSGSTCVAMGFALSKKKLWQIRRVDIELSKNFTLFVQTNTADLVHLFIFLVASVTDKVLGLDEAARSNLCTNVSGQYAHISESGHARSGSLRFFRKNV